MCGRFVNAADAMAIEERYQARLTAHFEKSYNIAPSQQILFLKNTDPHAVVSGTWGFRRNNSKIAPINARSEDVLTNLFFRDAFEQHRCLVPATHFYEWLTPQQGNIKIPYLINHKTEPIFSFAGLYSDDTVAILTTGAHVFMSKIHQRQPVILNRENEALWLSEKLSHKEAEKIFLYDPPLEAHAVSTRVNKPINNDPSLLASVISR